VSLENILRQSEVGMGLFPNTYTAEQAAHGNNRFTAIEMLGGFRFVELGGVRGDEIWRCSR
jgi:hypothetical protein